MWKAIRDWFWTDSETIWFGRFQAVGGFILSSLAGMDWTPLLVTGLTFRQLFTLGGTLFVQGVITEALRRYKARDV